MDNGSAGGSDSEGSGTLVPVSTGGSTFDINQMIIDFCKTQKGTIAAFFLFEMVSGYFDVVVPQLYGEITERLRDKGDISTVFIKLLGAWTGNRVATAVPEELDARFLPAVQTYVRTNLVEKVLDAYKENYQEPAIAEMIATVVRLPDIVYSIVSTVRSYFIPLFFNIMWTMLYMFKIHPRLGAVYTFSIVSVAIQALRIVKNCYSVSTEYDNQSQIAYEEIGDVLANMISVYSSGTVDDEMARLEAVQANMDKWYTATLRCGMKSKLIFNFIFIIFFGILNYVALDLYKKGEIGFGQVTAAFVMMLNILGTMGEMGRQASNLVYTVGVYNRIQDYLNQLATRTKTLSVVPIKLPVKGAISFKGVSIDKTPINNFFLEIKPGEKVGLIGKIGSGKSSLVKALMKILPYQGSLMVDGQEVKTLIPEQLRKEIAYISQSAVLFNRTIYENILYGSTKTEKDVDVLISVYKLETVFGDRKLTDSAGKNGENLSGGQKQIVMLLRNLLNPKPILILDEPTASLNQEMKEKVLEILVGLSNARLCTMILISHDPISKDLVERVVDISS